jgi:hypothetical protein
MSYVMLIVLFYLPIFTQASSVNRDLGIGEFYAAYRNASAGWRIEGSLSVNGGIEFFICDAENYAQWVRNESAILYEHNDETTDYGFNFTIPHNSTWYVVFANVQSNTIISLEADLFFRNQLGVAQTPILWTSQSTIITPTLIGFLIAISVICLVGVWISRRGEPFPAVKYEKILPRSG